MGAKFFTQQDLADRYHCSVRTLERKRLDGTGPPFLNVGKKPLYPVETTEEYERAKLVSSTAEAAVAGRHQERHPIS